MFRRETLALVILVAIPALGLAVNAVWPTAQPYATEQGLLLLLALAALLTVKATPSGAVFLYCSLALLPVGAMMERYVGMGGEWSALTLTPTIGVFVVAALTRDYLATLVYGLIAIGAGLVYGLIYNDLGQGGALAFVAGLAAFYALRWVECTPAHNRVELEKLRRDTNELGALAEQINQKQQELVNDT